MMKAAWLIAFSTAATLAGLGLSSSSINFLAQSSVAANRIAYLIYREVHTLLEEIAEAALDGNRKEHMELSPPCRY